MHNAICAREPIPAAPNQLIEASSGARDPGRGGRDSVERVLSSCVCKKEKKKKGEKLEIEKYTVLKRGEKGEKQKESLGGCCVSGVLVVIEH